MTDIATLERDVLAAIDSAADEAAVEDVRIGALGKSGSISALLKTLGGMTPDERKEKARIMQRILRADAEIRCLAEPWLGDLEQLMDAKQVH